MANGHLKKIAHYARLSESQTSRCNAYFCNAEMGLGFF